MSSTASPTPEDPAVATLRATLGKVYRLSTSDGRTFEGAFICIDRERNIILQDALESSQQDDTPPREVGMIMIPWKWVVKAEIEEDDSSKSWREKMTGMYF